MYIMCVCDLIPTGELCAECISLEQSFEKECKVKWFDDFSKTSIFEFLQDEERRKREEETKPKTLPRAEATPPAAKHIYELTLTTTKDDPYELRTALNKIIKSKMFNVKKYVACMELTKNNLPHVHACLWMDCKYVDVSKVKKFISYRYEFKPVRDLDAYLNYIKKEDGNNIIREYCQKKGIEQIWPKEKLEEEKVDGIKEDLIR